MSKRISSFAKWKAKKKKNKGRDEKISDKSEKIDQLDRKSTALQLSITIFESPSAKQNFQPPSTERNKARHKYIKFYNQ